MIKIVIYTLVGDDFVDTKKASTSLYYEVFGMLKNDGGYALNTGKYFWFIPTTNIKSIRFSSVNDGD